MQHQTNGLPTGQVAETNTDQKGNITTRVFDQAGRMISVTASGNTTTYTYYDNGSKHTVVYPDGSSEEYTYYDDGLLQTLVNKKADQTVIDSYTYTYDEAHNQTSKVDAKGATTYTYDDLNRLESVTEPSGKVTIYTFDAAGNRSTQSETTSTTNTVTSYTYNEQNRLTNTLTEQNNVITQTVAYTYDNNGNQLTVTTVPYVDGVPQTAQLTTSTYDKFNQLMVTTTSEGTRITNTYNGEGLRVVKQVDSQITIYIYEGDKVILELDGTGNQTARNFRGTNLISRTVDGTTLYYMYNGHADVTALIDTEGTIQATYYYDAFGNIMESTGNVNNPFTYGGYQYDKESNYYYLNARFYDPVTARFLSEDTYVGNMNDPLSLNLYTYCHNEPLMYSDPTGHSWLSTVISVGKSILGAIGTANKDKKGKNHSSSKGSSNSSILSTVVNTISDMLFGKDENYRKNMVKPPAPSTLILKLASDFNSIFNIDSNLSGDMNSSVAYKYPFSGIYFHYDSSQYLRYSFLVASTNPYDELELLSIPTLNLDGRKLWMGDNDRIYITVKPGDSLSLIAKSISDNENNWQDIQNANGLVSTTIYPGQALDVTDTIRDEKIASSLGTVLSSTNSQGVVYLRTHADGTPGEYVGKAKSEIRYNLRQWEHKYMNGKRYSFEELGRAISGEDLRVLEQTHMNLRGGAKSMNGTLENRINSIRPERWAELGIPDIVRKNDNGDDDDPPEGQSGDGSSGGGSSLYEQNIMPIMPIDWINTDIPNVRVPIRVPIRIPILP